MIKAAHYVNLRKTNKTDQNGQDCKIEETRKKIKQLIKRQLLQ